ncbi:uncharacterized protein LOC141613394 [Silene latifolia]|uniref:uncharacterized protein LOC141613394 n=1 Tax=Silene latifolia TaxID=37657 RepID=UPI003D7840EC
MGSLRPEYQYMVTWLCLLNGTSEPWNLSPVYLGTKNELDRDTLKGAFWVMRGAFNEFPLGGGGDTYWRAPAVGWDHCCTPKSEGGLGLKHSKNWNKTLLGKYIWWIASKKDHLWVKWVSHVYLKGVHWSNYTPPVDCSWSWKKIAHLMCIFKPAYNADSWLGKAADYSVTEGYNWLRSPGTPVSWFKLCWNSMNIPRASFIFWIYKLGRLLTKDRLAHMGGVSDLKCFLCSTEDENHGHLFFDCDFSSRCVTLLQLKLKAQFNPRELVEWNRRGRRRSILIRRIICACHIQLVYVIWQVRNQARIYSKVFHPAVLVKNLISDVCTRFQARNTSKLTREEEQWLQHIRH